MIQRLVRYQRFDRDAGSDRRAVVNDNVLLNFLNRGLINVGGDDDKLEHLRQTAADLARILEETPAKACSFALVAFDPHIPPTDPIIVEVRDALSKRWQTYVNTFAQAPISVFRAMLLDALNTACSCNDAVAVAFVASARNILPFMEVGEEQEIWAHVVGQIETKVEERSEKEWAVPTSISKLGIKFKPPTTEEIRISSKKVNITSLSQKLMAAAGPHATSPENGQLETNGNPHWPQNDPESWNYEFSRRTAETVGEAINKSVGGLSVEGIDLPAFTKDMTLAISDHLTKISQAVSNATAGLQRRTNLLWWKEALFSPSAQMSYRDMTSFNAAVLMAFDMHQQIPTFSPASVAAFLRETVVVALPTLDRKETVSIRELIEKTCDADVLSPLRTEAGNLVSAPTAGRCSILAVIGHSHALHQLDDQGFRDCIGITPDSEVTLPDWSVWIFRELQAARAIAEASTPKRTTVRKRAPRK